MDVRMPDGTVIKNVPDGVTQTDLQSRLDRHAATPKAKPPAEKTYDPTEGMGWGEKALVNLGAGIDTTWQGAKQLAGQGMSDEELDEKRRIDKHLAEQTTGGGLIQTAGAIAPAIPLGMAATMAAPLVGAGALAASPTLAAMGGGALSGALEPVRSDESRLQNVALGAAGGGVAPTALKYLVKAGRGAGQVAQKAAAALPGRWGERAAEGVGERRTADLLAKQLPGGIGPDVYTPHPHIGPSGTSAAVATQDPRLANLERGSRTSGGEHWQGFDEAGQRARWEAIDQGLQTSDDVARALEHADTVGAQVPYQAVGTKRFNKEMDSFFDNLQQAKTSPQYLGNPTVRNAVDWVEKTMAEAGQVTPELLHNMRRNISKGLTGAPGAGEAGVRAAQSEPFVISLAQAMDEVLDKSSKGKWTGWKGDYASAMQKAEAAKADVNIRNKFVDEATGTLKKPGVGGAADVPEVTLAALKQAVAQAGSMKRGPRKGQNILSTGSEDVLQGAIENLEKRGLLQRAKAASTGGSGSDTASNLAQSAAMEMLLPSGLGIGRFVLGEGGRKGNVAMQRQLAGLLQDPAALRQFLVEQEQQRLLRSMPPSLTGTGAGSAGLLTGPGE